MFVVSDREGDLISAARECQLAIEKIGSNGAGTKVFAQVGPSVERAAFAARGITLAADLDVIESAPTPERLAEFNLSYLPATPTTVALYIADRAGSLRSATITRRLTSITKAYQASGIEDSPSSSYNFVVSETLKGVSHLIGPAQQGKAPLLTADIRNIVAFCPETLSGLRDRALVLVGFAGAFRRSEFAAIDCTQPRTAWSSISAARRPTKRPQAARSAFPLGKRRPPARSARCAAGSPRPA
jgi:hypothetical protein